MKAKAQVELWAEVKSISKELSRHLIHLLRQEFSEEKHRYGSEDQYIPGSASTRDLSRRTLERFWKAALHSTEPFFSSSGDLPDTLYRRLHSRWIKFLQTSARPSFAPHLKGLQDAFRGVLVLEESRLEAIARKFRIPWESQASPISGQVEAAYDLFRGHVLRLWFHPDFRGTESTENRSFQESVEEGILLLGPERFATEDGFARLSRLGAYGAFRVRHRQDLQTRRIYEGGSQEGSLMEDVEVILGRQRLRRVATIQEGKILAVLTDVLDRDRLPTSVALQLAHPQWRIEQLFSDLQCIFDLRRFNASGPEVIQAQLDVAALLGAALRTAQAWIAEKRAISPGWLVPDVLFPKLIESVTIPDGFQAGERSHRGLESKAGQTYERWSIVDPLERDPVQVARRQSGIPGRQSGIPGRQSGIPGRQSGIPSHIAPVPAPRAEILAIRDIALDSAFEPFCRAYGKVGHRDSFLWRWVQRGIELTTLPSVSPFCRSPNRTVKLLGVMLDVLLDDVADNLKDGEFLDILLKIPFSSQEASPRSLGPERILYHRFTLEVWSEILRLASKFPRYQEFREVFEFDYRQLLNNMQYAYIVNRLPEMLNPTEHDLYQPHNMHMMISGTLDLMCSVDFDRRELGRVRQLLWKGQMMGRIGNMVSTWEREIKERDFTSGVFATAIEWGIVEATEMSRMEPKELISAIRRSGVIQYFLERWAELRDEVFELSDRIHSVDLSAYATGLENLIRIHLGSCGLK